MTAAKKIALAVVALAVAGAATWVAARPRGDAGNVPAAVVGTADAAPTDTARRAARAKRPAEAADDAASGTSRAEPLPPPVDLDRADRDLDLCGTVVDAAGHGVAGARVATVTYPWQTADVLNHAEWDREVAGPATRSAADGTFSLRLARGDAVGLRVGAPGFATVEMRQVLAGSRVRVTLRPGVRLVVALTLDDGRPAAGARVRLFNNDIADCPCLHQEGAAGADGVCAFDGLPPGAWAYVAPEHPAAIDSWTRVDLPESGETRTEIRLPAGRTLTGRVVDAATKAPIAGARVGMNWTLNMAVTTDDGGAYTLTGWTGGGIEDVHVLAEGYAREAKVVGAAERVDFEMTRGYAVVGRVVDADARPVAGARVGVVASDRQGSQQRISDGYATTGADGRFRATGLRVGMSPWLTVFATGRARLRSPTPVASSSADQDLGDLVLAAPHRVEGVVVGAGGAPQARVRIEMEQIDAATGRSTGYGGSATVFTDDLGRFRFADVWVGRFRLTAATSGASQVTAEVDVPPEGDVLGVRLEQPAVRTLAVTVTDAAGAPVAGSLIHVETSSGDDWTGRTDGRGRASVAVAEGASGTVSVFGTDGDRPFVVPDDVAFGADATEVSVVLREGATIVGRVVDPSGAPVARALLAFLAASGTDAAATRVVRSDERGAFEAAIPPGGRVTVVFDGAVLEDGAYVDSGLVARVEGVVPGADAVVVRCVRPAQDRSLTVVVVSPRGEPVTAARIDVRWCVSPGVSARTDDQGRAVLASLPARDVRVSVVLVGDDAHPLDDARPEDDFLAPATVEVEPDGRELRLACRAAVRITGTVVGKDGKPRPLPVAAFRGDEEVGVSRIGARGDFTILLPADDTAPVDLRVPDTDRDGRPDATAHGVVPGTRDVRLVVE